MDTTEVERICACLERQIEGIQFVYRQSPKIPPEMQDRIDAIRAEIRNKRIEFVAREEQAIAGGTAATAVRRDPLRFYRPTPDR